MDKTPGTFLCPVTLADYTEQQKMQLCVKNLVNLLGGDSLVVVKEEIQALKP